MRSSLAKALWPAMLVFGLAILIAAFGTKLSPPVFAANGQSCAQYGPYYPNVGPGEDVDENADWENDFLLVGQEYLFILATEDVPQTDMINVQIDDETADADIVRYAQGNGNDNDPPNDSWVPVSGVDRLQMLDNLRVDVGNPGGWWDTYDPTDTAEAFLEKIEDEFGLGDAFFDQDGIEDDCDSTASDGLSFIVVQCQRAGTFEITFWEAGDASDNANTESYVCVNAPDAISLTAAPSTIESHPAEGNVSHSLLVATVTDKNGDFVGENYVVDWSTTGCDIEGIDEAYYEDFVKGLFSDYTSTDPVTAGAVNFFLGPDWDHPLDLTMDDVSKTFLHDASPASGYQPETRAAAILHCEGADPGTYEVTARIDHNQLSRQSDISATADVTVVGPPAFISMVAEPTGQVCGEKSQILVTVTDALNQPVSDHTIVELITNYGGVLAGTGSSIALSQPVNPLSSAAAETFGGVATAYLLTSTANEGPYEVVAAAGGSIGAYTVEIPFDHRLVHDDLADSSFLLDSDNAVSNFYYYGNTGSFSTPVVTSQVTVTCSAATPPEVTAPDTGTGTIRPPNTGDAGLTNSPATSSGLLVIAGAAAFVLVALVSSRFARR